jgi:hypothetical protein
VPTPPATPPADPKAALMSAIREQNRSFYGMVVAQAQEIAIDGDAVLFTFAAVHRHLKTQLDSRREWVEQLALQATGRRLRVQARELPPPASAAPADRADPRRVQLEATAKAEDAVQAALDVFGGEIEDIEEIK